MELFYTDKIYINDSFSIQYSPDNSTVLMMQNDDLVESFSTNRKIYTFFKIIQEHIQSSNFLTIEGNLGDVYSGEIKLKAPVMMQLTNQHGCLTLDFYHITNNKKELLYLIPLTYTTKTLFKNMLIPYHLIEDPNYRYRHIFKFLDMIEILKLKEESAMV